MSSRVRSVCAVGALAIADQFFFKSSVSNGIRIRAITPTPRCTVRANAMIWISLMLVCLLAAGCISTGHADVANDVTIGEIHVGETTQQQILKLLGNPDSQIKTEMAGLNRELWFYSYVSAVINPIDYLLLYGFWFNGIGSYDTEYDLTVSFNHQGVVSSLSRMQTSYEMGRPFSSLHVSSISQKTLGSAEPGKTPIHFEDTMEFRD